MQPKDDKKVICQAVAKVLKQLRGKKSNYLLSAEYGISTSLLNHIERGIKDPQLTTIFKLSESLGVRPNEFIKKVEDNLPDGFSMIEN